MKITRINHIHADTSALEKQIDKMVRAGTQTLPLQGLTPEEIALVEGKNK